MMQHLRERLTLLLLALLPFHALLVTVGTKLIVGPGHAPLAPLALWKEGLLGVILVLMGAEYFLQRRSGTRELRNWDAADLLIAALLILGAVVTVLMHGDWKLAAFGFKYDFLPLVAFLIARRVPWSQRFQHAVVNVLLSVGIIVAAYGILTAVLPTAFFQWLGYGPAHSLYFADGPLAAFQQVSETALRRIQSTMSGPNQLGLWLLVPLGVLLSLKTKGRRILVDSFIRLLVIGAMILTFSRSAWIAAGVMVFVSVGGRIQRRHYKRAVITGIVGLLFTLALLVFPQPRRAAADVLFRLSSSRGHVVRPLQAIGRMIEHPLGMGLGTAGPASNRVSETCVFLRPQDDPAWAKSTPSLCVFLGTTQVQPADHVCRCPFLPENWYLQVGVELGVLGFAMFVALVILILVRLRDGRWKMEDGSNALRLTSYVSFLGISIAALVLHAWEDSAVAWTTWLLAAAVLAHEQS